MTEPEKNKDFDEQKPSTDSSNEPLEEKKKHEEKNVKETKPVFDVRKDLPGSFKPGHEEPQAGTMRVLLLALLIIAGLWYFMKLKNPTAPINYGFFLEQLEKDNIAKLVINGNKVSGEFHTPPLLPNSDSSEKTGPAADSKTAEKSKLPAEKSGQNPGEAPDAAANTETSSNPSSNPLPQIESTENPPKSTEQNQDSILKAPENTEEGKSPAVSSDPAPSDPAAAPSDPDETAKNANESDKTNRKSIFALNDQTKKPVYLPKRFTTMFPSLLEAGSELDQKIRDRVGKEFKVEESLDAVGYMMLLSIIVTIILVGSIWMQIRKTRDQLGGGQMFGFSKSPAKRFQGGEDVVTFDDVAGLKSVKEDLSEIVDFLKNSQKFERLGARIPKGVLMCGPPGTGKTLLARAIAGEATAAFYSINASEFIQLFVGVGASRVRDMFEIARNNAPSILFIDEIDAIGRQRGTGTGGGNDEREQTLNQILSEMDGFSTTESVIVIAATNRPDVLDPALLRPGRFDRHVTVDRPVHKDRLQLFKVHTKKVPLNADVDFEPLASMTTGLTGADIRNIVNEAALWACRMDRENVRMSDFYYAIDKVLMGTKREELISAEEKEKTSYHEAGHTLVAWLTPECDRVSKVSVIPRGRALGVTMSMPQEDRLMFSQREIAAKLKMMLGGREAEKLVYNELNAGAANDLERATNIAQKMVASWGMSPRIGPAAFYTADEHPFLGREKTILRNFSEKTAQIIDEEVMRILDDTARQVEVLLTENRNKLDALAHALVIREELDEAQIEEILGPPAQRRFVKE